MNIDRTHSGPKDALCAVCGKKIGGYESRWYGDTGAVHMWDSKAPVDRPRAAKCKTPENADKYPNYYTDG